MIYSKAGRCIKMCIHGSSAREGGRISFDLMIINDMNHEGDEVNRKHF